jgi:hypothetical protein
LAKRTEKISYLVRLWQTTENGEPVWRVLVRDVEGSEWQGFADMDSFFTFLRSQTSEEEFETEGERLFSEN